MTINPTKAEISTQNCTTCGGELTWTGQGYVHADPDTSCIAFGGRELAQPEAVEPPERIDNKKFPPRVGLHYDPELDVNFCCELLPGDARDVDHPHVEYVRAPKQPEQPIDRVWIGFPHGRVYSEPLKGAVEYRRVRPEQSGEQQGRWNYEDFGDGVYFCRGDHQSAHECKWEKLTTKHITSILAANVRAVGQDDAGKEGE